jgi:hypothetical protein
MPDKPTHVHPADLDKIRSAHATATAVQRDAQIQVEALQLRVRSAAQDLDLAVTRALGRVGVLSDNGTDPTVNLADGAINYPASPPSDVPAS